MRIIFLLALFLTPCLFAVNPNLSLNQYLHTSWTQEEGTALPSINALAQTSDGYLWLGTSKGLIRFDGMRFVMWSPFSGPPLPNSNISCLSPAAKGGLWVATNAGALCRVDRGRVIRYPAAENSPCPAIVSLLEDTAGTLWMLTACANAGTRVATISPDGTHRTFGPRDGLPDQQLRGIVEDRQGNLWLGTGNGLCRWSPGRAAECFPGPPMGIASIVQTGDGTLFVADDMKNQVFRVSGGKPAPWGSQIQNSLLYSNAMACDRDGNIWLGTRGQGLLRLRDGKVDRFTRSEGLSGNMVSSILEDHEGDIWVGTARGVDRIRDPKVQVYSTLNGLSSDVINTVYGARSGEIWIGTTMGLNRMQSGFFSRPPSGLPDPNVASLYEDTSGKLWVGNGKGLAMQTGHGFVSIPAASGANLTNTFNIAGDRSGAIWFADRTHGLFTVRGGAAYPVEVSGSSNEDISALLVARNGDLWIGHYRGGGINILCNDGAKHYDGHDGLGNGPVRVLFEGGDGSVWAGTGDGVSRFHDGGWTSWGTAQGLPSGGVQGIVDDESGGLWLLTPAAVLRLSVSDLASPAKSIPIVQYGSAEGLRFGSGMANPRLARSRDGRLWVGTEDGVAAIDPSRVHKNPVAPPVAIEQIVADGKNTDPASGGEIAFRGHELQITYTGISLMVPERVQFRYWMEHQDSQWTDAGARRDVAYMNLKPGNYKFHVMASNNDGLWNTTGAVIDLRVIPYFYQTTWFLALCAASVAFAVWSAHFLRVRSVVSRVKLISAERVRFSRELHDSLLQGFAGVVYLLEAAAQQFDRAPDRSKQHLERALDQADESLREARQMIVSMRIPALDNSILPEALRTTTAQMISDLPLVFEFEVKGRPHQAPYDVEANLFVIAREAVTNALNHAEAKRIRLEMSYTPKQLRILIQDDGAGFDTAKAMAKSGHFGMRGMQERARQIGAAFTVNSAPGRGASIEVVFTWKK